MHFKRILYEPMLLLPLTAVACSEGNGSSTDFSTDFSVSGSVTGSTVPTGAKAVVIWTVSSGSPDYAYKFGEGPTTDTRFTVTFSDSPPTEAINSYGLGIGVVGLVAEGTEIPTGRIDVGEREFLGVTPRHAVIWRSASANDLSWSTAFPRGFSCGQCVPASPDETFDAFAPVDCSQVQIQAAALEQVELCNWT
jgi:hypothetical protein